MKVDKELSSKESIDLYILIVLLSGVLGFIYEEIFYWFDLGKLIKRGSTYGPWIPIYMVGALLITFLTYRYRGKPLIVFLLSTLVTGLLEYFTGFILLQIFHIRLWNYNTEILNFGNIQGFICLRSVLLFGISGVFLIEWLIPRLKIRIQKKNNPIFHKTCIGILIIILTDIIIYAINH